MLFTTRFPKYVHSVIFVDVHLTNSVDLSWVWYDTFYVSAYFIIKQMGRSNKSTFKMRWKYCLLSFTKHQKLFYFTILEMILKRLMIFAFLNLPMPINMCIFIDFLKEIWAGFFSFFDNWRKNTWHCKKPKT